MTCPLVEQVLRLGTGTVGREEAAQLEAHARRCEECLRAVQLIARTAGVLREATAEPQPDEVRRIEQGLVAWHRKQAAWKPVRIAVAWSAAAAAVVLVASGLSIAFDRSRSGAGDGVREAPREDAHKNLYHAAREEPREKPEKLAAALPAVARFPSSTKVTAGRARVVTGSEAALAFQPGPELSVLDLREGHIAVAIDELASAESFVVATPDARIEVLGATFQVKAGPAGTAVYVDEGVVRVKTPEHGAPERTLRKGERLVVSPAPAAAKQQLAPAARAVREDRDVARAARGDREDPSAPRDAEPAAVRDTREARGDREDPSAARDAAPVAVRDTREAREISPDGREARDGREVAANAQEARDARENREAAADARAAREVAPGPPPAAAVVALMSDADQARRRGEMETALAHYRRAADHPRAGSYAEEALLRAARIEAAAGRSENALRDLDRAAQLFPRGTLQPERAALAASIARTAGRTDDALRIIEALPHDARSMSLAEERLALARAITATDPIAARRLLAPLPEGGPSPAIRRAATELLGELDAKK